MGEWRKIGGSRSVLRRRSPRLSTRIGRFFGFETGTMREGRLAYERGVRAESRVADALEGDGWLVKMSAGSRGAYDIEAFRSGERIFVQVKSGFAWPTKSQISTLAKRAARRGASAYVIHEHRGALASYPVCRWCCSVGYPGARNCANCRNPF